MAGRERLLLDTCALLWFSMGNPRFTKETARHVQEAAEEDRLYVSIMTLWEMGYLERKGRLQMEIPCKQMWDLMKEKMNLRVVPITENIVMQFHALDDALHNDPGDRFIVGTALQYKCSIVTGDPKIIAWAEKNSHSIIEL